VNQAVQEISWPPSWLASVVAAPPIPQSPPSLETAAPTGPTTAHAEPHPSIPSPSAWRSVLATWTIEMRQEWGELANVKQDEGMAWAEAEWRAFWFVGDKFEYNPDTRSYRLTPA
jgi:hypothetical protein